MLFNILFLILCLNFTCASAFFLWKLKKESFFFCYKVCPLYCSKIKRADLDYAATSFVEDEWADQAGYWEEPPDHHDHVTPHEYIYPHHDHSHGPHDFEIVKHLKFIYHPKTTTTTTTTSKPTTEEPSGICIACMKKCKDWPSDYPWY